MARIHKSIKRSRSVTTILCVVPMLLLISLLSTTTTLQTTSSSKLLPWPCLFASASLITQRYTSSLYQSTSPLKLFPFTTQQQQQQRDLGNNYQADDQYINQGAQQQYDDDAVNEAMNEKNAYDQESAGDDGYLNMNLVDMDEVSIMPISCVNYHNGHMIKFQFFEKSSSLSCHFKNLGTYVVSIAHYMRAYFNYQALTHGNDFTLPGDVGLLNCVMIKETADYDVPLYAKIGCQHRDTYTSTKLHIIVYTDAQCSQGYGGEIKSDGYDLNGYFLSNKVSFRPPFYNCQNCKPDEISNTFSKQYSGWYDDDYIATNGHKRGYQGDDAEEEEEVDVDDASYYQTNDDTYNYAAYDDAADDGNNYNHYVNYDDNVKYNYQEHDDAFYNMDDGFRRGLREVDALDASHSLTARETFKDYQADFEQEMSLIHRQLEDAANGDDGYVDNTASWNICKRVHKYGMWCDADCQALDTFRVDEWSRSDVFLLVIMCVFMGAMMLLVFAKRVKAYERAAMWGDEPGAPNPGLPPCAMLMLFAIVYTIIITLAALRFVNETLVFAVVTCVLLFIYMLKLTLFESRKQVFLPARANRNHKEPFLY